MPDEYRGEPRASERHNRATNTVASANTWKCWLGCERRWVSTEKQLRPDRKRSAADEQPGQTKNIQGQEAPIVIYSMTTSTNEREAVVHRQDAIQDSTRGLACCAAQSILLDAIDDLALAIAQYKNINQSGKI
jgi:hypothetical protein